MIPFLLAKSKITTYKRRQKAFITDFINI